MSEPLTQKPPKTAGISPLLEAQFTFSRLLPRLLDEAIRMGYTLTLGEAYRTPEQAALNAVKGIGISNSLHGQRLAIDLQLFREGKYLPDSSDYKPLGVFWEELGKSQIPPVPLSWGGRFVSRPDGNHFSLEYQGIR